MRLGRVVFVLCGAFSVACSGVQNPDAPATTPDVRGIWGGPLLPWGLGESYPYVVGNPTATSRFDGTLAITAQADGSFEGRYQIDDGGSAGTIVDGHVGADGRLTFRLHAETGWDPSFGPRLSVAACHLSEPSRVYEGSLSQGVLDAARVEILDCPTILNRERALVTSSFRGVRTR